MDSWLVFDLETDGLLDELTVVHCLTIVDYNTGEEWAYRPHEIEAGLKRLEEAEVIIGHNVIEFDIPAAQKLYPGFTPPRVLDTLCGSRTAYAGKELQKIDMKRRRRGEWLELDPFRPNSLHSWGVRLGERKLDKPETWDTFTEHMLGYCMGDTRLTRRLLRFLLDGRVSLEVLEFESRLCKLFLDMETRGVAFDENEAAAIMSEMVAKREELTDKLRKIFPPWLTSKGKIVTPKRDMTSKKYKPGEIGYKNVRIGCAYQGIKLVEFNPASGEHIARALKQKYGWKPTAFTDGGKPETSEKIMRDLPFPEAASLSEYAKVKKLLGYISEGKNSWLKCVRGGRIHGHVQHVGTVTHRVSHQRPNTGNIPSRTAEGKRCRHAFKPSRGWKMVGVDASGLQLRCLGHYLGKYDGGKFAGVISDPGMDIHDHMRKATGIINRDPCQKNVTYGYLFGAGDPKLGLLVIEDRALAKDRGLFTGQVPRLSASRRLGRDIRGKLETGITGLGALRRQLRLMARRGYLRGLDGRKITILSDHVALNTLLMSAEAVIMKTAMLLAPERLADEGLPMGERWHPVLFVHDEVQNEAEPEIAQQVGDAFVWAIQEAGRRLQLRCPLDGEVKIGDNWAETH